MRVDLKLDGTTKAGGTALIVHNERTVDALDPFVKAIKAVRTRGATDEEHLDKSRLEFLAALYTDPVITPDSLKGAIVMPTWNVVRCLQDGAKRYKRGPDVLRGIQPLVESVPIRYEGDSAKTPEALWKAGTFALRKGVGIGSKKVMKTRPIFREWSLVVPIEVDTEIFNVGDLEVLWRAAGRYAGLCEMRPIYGRFNATLEVVK